MDGVDGSGKSDTPDSGNHRQTEAFWRSESPDTAQGPTGKDSAALSSSPTNEIATTDGKKPAQGGGGNKLASERPAVVEGVFDEDVVADFNSLGSSETLAVVGCVVASVSREPFEATEVSPRVRSARPEGGGRGIGRGKGKG